MGQGDAPVSARRQRLHFSVRSLLLATLVIGTAFGLYANWIRRQRQAIDWIQRRGGSLAYDYQKDPKSDEGNVFDFKAAPPGPSWLRRIVGDEPFRSVVMIDLTGKPVTDENLEILSRFPKLENLNLSKTRVTSAGLAQITGLTRLKFLAVTDTHIDDTGLMYLRPLTQMRLLFLDGTNVTDDGLKHLEGMTKLQGWLGLTHTGVTDAGLVHLQGLKELRSVNLLFTKVTKAGATELGRFLPKALISYHDEQGRECGVWPRQPQ